MRWKVTTPPTVEPLTLALAKTHLRIATAITDFDTEITALIAEIRGEVEKELDLAMVEQTITLSLDNFPQSRELLLPQTNLMSVTSVKYTDSNGDEQTVATSVYGLSIYGSPGRIFLKANQEWPISEVADQSDAVTIVYQAGFGAAAANVPGSVTRAMKLLLSDAFENREATVLGVSSIETKAVKRALVHFKRFGV